MEKKQAKLKDMVLTDDRAYYTSFLVGDAAEAMV